MWNLEKKGRGDLICKAETDTDAENQSMDTKGGRDSGMDWETGIDKYTLACIQQITL